MLRLKFVFYISLQLMLTREVDSLASESVSRPKIRLQPVYYQARLPYLTQENSSFEIPY